jgi:hypothetical protein
MCIHAGATWGYLKLPLATGNPGDSDESTWGKRKSWESGYLCWLKISEATSGSYLWQAEILGIWISMLAETISEHLWSTRPHFSLSLSLSLSISLSLSLSLCLSLYMNRTARLTTAAMAWAPREVAVPAAAGATPAADCHGRGGGGENGQSCFRLAWAEAMHSENMLETHLKWSYMWMENIVEALEDTLYGFENMFANCCEKTFNTCSHVSWTYVERILKTRLKAWLKAWYLGHLGAACRPTKLIVRRSKWFLRHQSWCQNISQRSQNNFGTTCVFWNFPQHIIITYIIYDHHRWSSYIYICDHHIWSSSSYMIIIYDHHIWSSYMIIIYDYHIWSSYMIIIHDDHTWSSYMIIIHEHHTWSSFLSSYMIIIYDQHIWSSYMIIMHDHHTSSSYMIILKRRRSIVRSFSTIQII